MTVTPLSVSNSSLKVMNAALAQIGVPDIASFTENTLAAKTGNRLFADILEDELSAYPWRFARDRVTLTRLNETAPSPWTGLYQLPTSAIALSTIYVDDSVAPFDRFGFKIAVNVDANSSSTVTAEYTNTVGADGWPGYFRRAFVLSLAAAISMPITQDEQTSAALAKEAEMMMLKARSRDAQGRTPSRLNTKLFIKARRTHRNI